MDLIITLSPSLLFSFFSEPELISWLLCAPRWGVCGWDLFKYFREGSELALWCWVLVLLGSRAPVSKPSSTGVRLLPPRPPS